MNMWSSRLFWKLFLGCVGLILVSAIAFAVLVSRQQEQEMRRQLTERLYVSAVLLRQLVKQEMGLPGQSDLQEQVKRLGQEIQTRLTVIAPEGTVLADSEQPTRQAVAAMSNHRQRPEIDEALRQGMGRSERLSPTMNVPFIYLAVRVEQNEQTLGVARTSLPVATIDQKVRHIRRLVWQFATVVTMLGVAFTYWLVARIIKPLARLTDAAEAIADGRYDQPVLISNRDEIGQLAGAFHRMRKELVSRIAELRERGDQLATVLGGMVEGVIAVDDRGQILFANEAAGRLLGFGAETAHRRPLRTTVRDKTLHRVANEAMAQQRMARAEIELGGVTRRILAVHAAPLPGQPCPGVVLVLYDMTELRRLETLRQEFVANVSHELKTPLSSIKAYAETLREGAINDRANNRQFVERIEDQAERLHQLILDLLSLARIESGQQAFDIDVVDVGQVIETSLAAHRAGAVARKIQLRAEPPGEPVQVRADEEGLREILDNLINNAINYTPSEGSVSVRWQRDGSMALIQVEDTGIGIAPEDQPRVFERFFRVDKARSRELGGTGLGLSIVKHLAQFFGGTVGVRSRPGEGSIFWVRLPLNPS